MTSLSSSWTVYIVKCSDNSLYTGCTTDLARRVAEHNGDDDRGARYTRSRRPVTVVYSEVHHSRSSALKREQAIKRLSRAGKLVLCVEQSGAAVTPL